jgi:hypothetical protein
MLRATLAALFSLAVSSSTFAEEGKEQPAKLLDYYAVSLFPHLISPDLSYVQRFYACFEVDGHVVIGTKLWPIGKHDIFTSSRQGGPLSKGGDSPILSARYDVKNIWVTFERGERAELKVNHSRNTLFHEEQCRTGNHSPN